MQKFMSGKQFIQDVQATKASPSNFCTQRSRQWPPPPLWILFNSQNRCLQYKSSVRSSNPAPNYALWYWPLICRRPFFCFFLFWGRGWNAKTTSTMYPPYTKIVLPRVVPLVQMYAILPLQTKRLIPPTKDFASSWNNKSQKSNSFASILSSPLPCLNYLRNYLPSLVPSSDFLHICSFLILTSPCLSYMLIFTFIVFFFELSSKVLLL